MPKDIEVKVKNIVEGNNLSESQLDRVRDPRLLLMDYLSTHIDKINGTNLLKKKIEEQLQKELDEEKLSTGAMLKVYEILTNQEVAQSNGVINLLAKALEVKKDDGKKGDSSDSGKASTTETFTQEEIAQAKNDLSRVNGFLKAIEKGEFNPKEFLKKKE